MQECAPPQKVLVAVDGSEQSLRAIRYAANVFPPYRTHIVLFHVQAQLFELFSDLDAYPHYKSRVTGLKRWATEQKMDISNTEVLPGFSLALTELFEEAGKRKA